MKAPVLAPTEWGLAEDGPRPRFLQLNVTFVRRSLVVSVGGLMIGAADCWNTWSDAQL